MKNQSETPAYQDRFSSVDVLSLLDPNWLENTQAAQLVQMMKQKQLESAYLSMKEQASTPTAV